MITLNVSIQDFESIPNFLILELLPTVLFQVTVVGGAYNIEMYILVMHCMI